MVQLKDGIFLPFFKFKSNLVVKNLYKLLFTIWSGYYSLKHKFTGEPDFDF